MTDTVTAAAAAVDYDAWVNGDDGDPIPQSSAPTSIRTIVDLLDIRPGISVLEIGTGTGYSSALLAEVVGPSGRVVSIDVDQELVERAADLHQRAGHQQVEIHTADGFAGWPAVAPYDRIIGWTTPHVVPQAWVEQVADGGII
ncbi:MAG: protein-L-isoaspartate O-methyltransferase family protein, partial [Sciscionella sp.]